jgi:hypothetical protein
MRKLPATLRLAFVALLGLIFFSTASSGVLAGEWQTVSQEETSVVQNRWPSNINLQFRDGGS